MTALALFTVACEHFRKSESFASELCDLLGYDDGYAGRISDALYSGTNFDNALGAEGFTVAKKRKAGQGG